MKTQIEMNWDAQSYMDYVRKMGASRFSQPYPHTIDIPCIIVEDETTEEDEKDLARGEQGGL